MEVLNKIVETLAGAAVFAVPATVCWKVLSLPTHQNPKQ